MSKINSLLLSALLLSGISGYVSAQTVTSDTRLQQLQQFDTFFKAPQPDSAGQSEALPQEDTWEEGELGQQRILLEKKIVQPWRLFADTSLLYTSNAFLTRDDARGDGYFAGTVGGMYTHNLSDSVNLNFSVRQQFFRYFDYSVLDFDHGSLGARISWLAPESLGNVLFFGRWQWNRLTAARSNPSGISFGDEFLRYHTFSVGAQKLFFLDSYNYIFAGIATQFGLTEDSRGGKASDPQKDTYSFFAGYTYIYSRSLTTQIGYYLNRNVYDHIRTASGKLRNDWNHVISASAIWTFNENLNLGSNLSYTWNQSNERFFRYETATFGANLEFSYRF